ncbi:hypothetical protein BURMUCGD1_6481 [Burkholderia multivorans CGD1]|nr:hypothetical protein BURMUCGD1_6481 [Burkholderia multivorans CGD1]
MRRTRAQQRVRTPGIEKCLSSETRKGCQHNVLCRHRLYGREP